MTAHQEACQRRICREEVKAYLELIVRYEETVRNWVRERVPGEEKAKEERVERMVREVFIRAWRAWDQGLAEEDFEPCLHELTQTVVQEQERGEEETKGMQALSGLIWDRVHQLAEPERLPLLLYYFGEGRLEGVAAFLEWPVEMVRERVERAQQRLQEDLWQWFEGRIPRLRLTEAEMAAEDGVVPST